MYHDHDDNGSPDLNLSFQTIQLDGSMAGDVGFDPLGLSNINGVGIDLYWLREAELKHCRLVRGYFGCRL